MTTTITATILETISDNLLFITIIYAINILQKNIENLFFTYKKQIIVSIFVSCFISIVFNQNYFSQIVYLKWLLIFINFSKYILLTSFIYKKINIRSIIISLIIQFMCSNITSAIFVLIPVNDKKEYYFLNIILHLFIRLIVLLIILFINKTDNHDHIRTVIATIPQYTFILFLLSLFLSDGLIQAANFNTTKVTTQIYI